MIEKQRTEFSVKKRNQINKTIDSLIFEEYPYVLLWHIDNTRLLYWNKFNYPKKPLGIYSGEGFTYDYWWIDQEKDKKLKLAIQEKKKLN